MDKAWCISSCAHIHAVRPHPLIRTSAKGISVSVDQKLVASFIATICCCWCLFQNQPCAQAVGVPLWTLAGHWIESPGFLRIPHSHSQNNRERTAGPTCFAGFPWGHMQKAHSLQSSQRAFRPQGLPKRLSKAEAFFINHPGSKTFELSPPNSGSNSVSKVKAGEDIPKNRSSSPFHQLSNH